MAFAQGARLSSEAARSSIVRARNSAVVGLGVAYGL
jgi:outer membrane scaffolding protein for murein synthesis (MipA/OmpV family)